MFCGHRIQHLGEHFVPKILCHLLYILLPMNEIILFIEQYDSLIV